MDEILHILKTKSSTKQEVYRITHSIFKELSNNLKSKVDLLNDQIQKLDSSVHIEYLCKGDFETHISFSGDRLIFHMHSNIFDFPKSHSIHKTKYISDDPLRSFCGVIHVYNFLNDSFKYNRFNDVGHLIARIFINKERRFFVEGEDQLNFLFDDFVNQEINETFLKQIIDSSILFALNFDLLSPNFKDINLINVHQILDMNNNHKLRTSKTLGFKFDSEDK